MRASEKLPFQGKWYTLAPNRRAMSALLSPDPVSTTTISCPSALAERSAAGRCSASSFTIMQTETLAHPFAAGVTGPASFLIWSAASMAASSSPNSTPPLSISSSASRYAPRLIRISIRP